MLRSLRRPLHPSPRRAFGRLAATAALVLTGALLPAVGTAGSAGAAATAADEPGIAVTLDLRQIRATLSQAPSVSARGRALTFRLPNPDGGSERFALQRTQTMEAGLAAQHPEITTYAGNSLDHPGTTVAIDVSPLGLHASVRGPLGQGAWYVDPATVARGTTAHRSYYGSEVDRSEDTFVERETPAIVDAVTQRDAKADRLPAPRGLVRQRVYRLALLSDPSYAAYFGSANVLAAKVTLINRVNQIYGDDLAISLRLVDATDALNLDTDAKATGANGPCGAHACFDAADPNDKKSIGQLDACSPDTLFRTRTVLGELVGAGNYDIGHLALGVNGGGIAFLGVVGEDFKASGCTGLPFPKGDFYAIDYVAHEMGHQFGANHTFDGVKGACAGGNRVRKTSVEPGSGSSVMAYAGICGNDDLQPHTDPYFSQRSFQEITAHTRTVTSTVEVQTVSLRGFDGADTVTLGFGSAAPITLTRGSTYTRAGVRAAVERLTGQRVIVAKWGYDPFSSPKKYPAPYGQPDDSGFQVIFNTSAKPFRPGTFPDVASLSVAATGATGTVAETAQGGRSGSAGTVTTTTNHQPRVKAPVNRTIPIRTPFTLTGKGRDADGQPLTYLWEQNDPGTGAGTALASNRKTSGPLFRVFGAAARVGMRDSLLSPAPGINLAGIEPTRTFPDLKQVLAGNTNAATGGCPDVTKGSLTRAQVECYSEFLPTGDYVGSGTGATKLHFRLTARDGLAPFGGSSYDDVALRVDKTAGPFLVSSFDRRTTVRAGSRQRIDWEVNGTRRLAQKVRILLSTDNGKTFRKVLARTANDGHAVVRMPRTTTGKARIMIEAVDNYFFAVNDARFRIR